MKKILVNFAHPFPEKSRANCTILESLESLPGVTVNDLYEKYPYFNIDIQTEQDLLTQHDIIVFQHPIYWYSVPPLLKMWYDEVLELGFAYGENGDKLAGKLFQLSITAGGAVSAYSKAGFHETDIQDFFPPWRQTARLCKMLWQEPLILHNAGRATDDELAAHAEEVRKHISHLSLNAIGKEAQP